MVQNGQQQKFSIFSKTQPDFYTGTPVMGFKQEQKYFNANTVLGAFYPSIDPSAEIRLSSNRFTRILIVIFIAINPALEVKI